MGYELFLAASAGSAPIEPEKVKAIALSLGASKISEAIFNFRERRTELYLTLLQRADGNYGLLLSLEYGGTRQEAEFAFNVARRFSIELGLDIFDSQMQRMLGEDDFQYLLERWQQHSDWAIETTTTGVTSPAFALFRQEEEGLFAWLPGSSRLMIAIAIILIILGFVAFRTCSQPQQEKQPTLKDYNEQR